MLITGKAGIKDVLLIREQPNIWLYLACGRFITFINMSYAASHIHDYSIKLYENLEKQTGLSTGLKKLGFKDGTD